MLYWKEGFHMNIRPSEAIRQNYDEIAELCRETGEPVYLTKNGEGDLVVMDIENFTRREKMLKLREQLLAVEKDRLHEIEDHTLDEVSAYLDRVISEAWHMGEQRYKVVVSDRSMRMLNWQRRQLSGIPG